MPADPPETLPIVRAVVFDLLTALLDSWTVWDVTAGGTEPGRRWRARYLELTYGCGPYRPYEDLVAEAARDAGLPSSAPAALHEHWDELAPWPEAAGVLAGLRSRGVLLGIATNCSAALGRRAAARAGAPFDAVVTSEEAGFYKPRPEPYRAALAARGRRALGLRGGQRRCEGHDAPEEGQGKGLPGERHEPWVL